VLAAACNGSPAQPSAAALDLTGTWNGQASDSSGPGRMTWLLTQSGASFSGSLRMTDTNTGLTGRGSITGTVSDMAIQFTLSVAAGGFDEPNASCAVQATGSGRTTTTEITATYAGANSCSGDFTAGELTLFRQ
jgi:hypothetical protein